MFKNTRLNYLWAATYLLVGILSFTFVAYEHIRIVNECNRLGTLLETTLVEKALLQTLIDDHKIEESSTLD
jgi:hypothetical protein